MNSESVREWTLPAVLEVQQRARGALEKMAGLSDALTELNEAEGFLRSSSYDASLVHLSTRVLIATILGHQENYRESCVVLEEVLPGILDDEKELRYAALYAYAVALHGLGEGGRSFRLFHELDRRTQAGGPLQERVRILTHKANILHESGDHLAAMSVRSKAVEYSRQVPDAGLRARTLISMGFEQMSVGDAASAERSLQEADLELVATEDVSTRARALLLQGSVELKRERYRDALKGFLTGLRLLTGHPDEMTAARLKLCAARAHNYLGEVSQAEPLAIGAAAFFCESGHQGLWLESLLEESKAALGRRNFEVADERAEFVRQHASAAERIDLAHSAARLLADIAESRDELASAVAWFRDAENLKEQIFQRENAQRIDLMRARQETHELQSRERTDQARAESLSDLNGKLREKNAELEQLHHEKRELLTIIAHDLRNQLGASVNYTEMALLMHNPEVEDLRGQLQTIFAITRSTQELLEHLLSLERVESGHVPVVPESLDLGAWTRELAEWAENLGRVKGIRCTVTLPEASPILEIDRTWLRLAVENYLTNAFKYSPVGSEVAISVRTIASRLRIEVGDEGPGIPDEDRGNLFTKFHRTRNEPTGSEFSTGLGLYLVRKYAELLGCEVGYRPGEPKGSIFFLEFDTTPGENAPGEHTSEHADNAVPAGA